MSVNEQLVAARERAGKVLNFIKTNKLPPELVNEINSYCNSAGISSASVMKSSKVIRYLRHPQQVLIARHICGNLLDNVCLFKGCSDYFKDFLIVSMSTVNYSPDDYIFRLGELATDMFVVLNGSVDELVEDSSTLTGEKVVLTARSGQALGALALFFELRHMYSSRIARTSGATCLKLSRDRFLQLLKYCPQEEERITENAMRSFQRKFGSSGTPIGDARTATSHASTRGESEMSSKNERSTRTAGSDVGTNSDESGVQGMGKKARHSISLIKSRRTALRTHILLSAARTNDLARTEWALQGGHIDINACDDLGRSALHVASSEGHIEMVELLLRSSADCNLRDRLGNTPLNDAVRHRHDTVAAAIRRSAPDLRVSLEENAVGMQMCEAAATGNLAEIERLVRNGVSSKVANYDHRTALHLAACEGRLNIVSFLIESKANVQAKDRLGNSPLDDAIRQGHRPVQLALRAAGARVGWMRNGLRACRASAVGDEESVRLVRSLVEMGLDPVACDRYDRTPLHIAACTGKLALLEFLMGLASRVRYTKAPSSTSSSELIISAFSNGAIVASSEVMRSGSQIVQESLRNLIGSSTSIFLAPRDLIPVVSNVDDCVLRVGFINAIDSYGFTPLDDAIRHGNTVSALALEQAGGLRSTDPRMTSRALHSSQARSLWWREARRSTVAEEVSKSPEMVAWRSAEGRALPAFRALINRVEEGQKQLRNALTSVLLTLLEVFRRLNSAELTFTQGLGSARQGVVFCSKQQTMREKEKMLSETEGSDDGFADAGLHWQSRDDAALAVELENAVQEALDAIDVFCNSDMDKVQEATTSLDALTHGRHLQPTCAGLAQSLQILRMQVAKQKRSQVAHSFIVSFDSMFPTHVSPFQCLVHLRFEKSFADIVRVRVLTKFGRRAQAQHSCLVVSLVRKVLRTVSTRRLASALRDRATRGLAGTEGVDFSPRELYRRLESGLLLRPETLAARADLVFSDLDASGLAAYDGESS